MNLLDFPALKAATVKHDPYTYFALENSICEEQIEQVMADFPDIRSGGSFNQDDVQYGPAFGKLIASLNSDNFRQLMGDKFSVDVMKAPMMTTLRGYSRAKDGRIHTDSKTKLLTILIYLNPAWPHADGRLRILRDGKNMENFAEEIVPGPGTLLAFKVQDNGWHGYPSFEGQRRSVQINFLTSERAKGKHRFFHRLSARLKRHKTAET